MALALRVEATSGHWGAPGNTPVMGVSSSFPVPPPSTIRGFLESLTGDSFESFRGRFAYGQLREAAGHGCLARQAAVWSAGKEQLRFIRNECWFDVAFCVLVEGHWEEKIRAALRGEVDTFGCLYLGESDDLVHWVDEMKDPMDQVEWVVPGTKMRLPVKTGRGYSRIEYETATFDLRVGAPVWVVER